MPSPTLILWAEDAPADQAMIRFAVEDLRPPPVIQFANDGVDLLEALRATPAVHPDMVIVDLNMPRMGGIDTLRAIRADPALRDLRVAVFTGGNVPEEIAQCRALGAEFVLQKPIGFAVFRMLVHGIVSRIHNPRPIAQPREGAGAVAPTVPPAMPKAPEPVRER